MTGRMVVRVAVLGLTLVLCSCGSDDSGASSSTTVVGATTAVAPIDTPALEIGPASACAQAFEAAVDVAAMADSVEDLYPAARACGSLAEWSSAAAANPGAIEVDAVEFAYNMCSGAPLDIASTALCAEAIEADPLGIEALFPNG